VVRNELEEQRLDQTNWFNRPFNNVIFDGNPVVASTVFLQEDIAGVKDAGFEQQLRSTKDTLNSFGFNAEWQATDRLSFAFDAHSSDTESEPNGPLGTNSVLVSMGAPVVAAHSLDLRSGFPVQQIVVDDTLRGNGNGSLDAGDLGSQVARTITSSQEQGIDELRFDTGLDLEVGRLDAGIGLRDTEMTQLRTQTQQTLGDWGIGRVGDIPTNLIQTFCLTCLFEDFDPRASGGSLVNFRANAADLYRILSPQYAALGRPVNLTQQENNRVEEEITSAYVQFTWDGELGRFPVKLVTGVRFEDTDVTAVSLVPQPGTVRPGALPGLIWQADNDFTLVTAPPGGPVATVIQEASYSNVLPSVDFAVDLQDDVKLRFSVSETIARAGFADLFSAVTPETPPRPTALGGVPTGNGGNPALEPLESTNLDLSLEWYYGETSYVSIAYFNKEVDKFVGSGVTTMGLLELRDPSSGRPGTRSGDATQALVAIGATQSDVNLFTMTALIQEALDAGASPANAVANATATFQANRNAQGNLSQTFVDNVLQRTDVEATAADPLAEFAVNLPVNTEEGTIDGFEIAALHFFGDSGLGLGASYTDVDGDVAFNVGAPRTLNQFALLGLSDTANVSLIYEKNRLSARLTYNWRDDFLSRTNRGADRNPVFVDDFSQLDLNVTYNIRDNWTVSFEGINITAESLKTFGRGPLTSPGRRSSSVSPTVPWPTP
jgi:TonB-dependent receptor